MNIVKGYTCTMYWINRWPIYTLNFFTYISSGDKKVMEITWLEWSGASTSLAAKRSAAFIWKLHCHWLKGLSWLQWSGASTSLTTNRSAAFIWKLRCHWLKSLSKRQIANSNANPNDLVVSSQAAGAYHLSNDVLCQAKVGGAVSYVQVSVSTNDGHLVSTATDRPSELFNHSKTRYQGIFMAWIVWNNHVKKDCQRYAETRHFHTTGHV